MLHCNFDFILLNMLNCGTPTGNWFSLSLSLTLCCCMCMYCAYKLFMLWVLLVSISLREYLVLLYCLLASYLADSTFLPISTLRRRHSKFVAISLSPCCLPAVPQQSSALASTLLSRTGVVYRYLVSSLVCNIIFGRNLAATCYYFFAVLFNNLFQFICS